MLLLLLRLPHVCWHLSRGGVLGHLSGVWIFPPWLRSFFRLLDGLLAKRVAGRVAKRDGERAGIALVHALTALGPGFIKFGQALSTRADLIGAEVARDLASLQDRLAPFSPVQVREIIAQELGEVETIFSEFDDEAVAAASIAQVHFATLVDGRDVAVKILRPGIRTQLMRDFAFFRSAAELVERIAPATRRLKLVAAVDQFAHYSDVELDLRLEAASASKLGANHKGDEGIAIPSVEWHLTTEQILVMERVDGIRIDDRAALEAQGHDINAITKRAAACFFDQVFRDGFFHADMHPGNIFVRADGVLVPVDFGIMGDLSLEDRLFLARLLIAILDRDYDMVAKLHRDAGMIGEGVSLAHFAQAVCAVVEPVMDQPMGTISLGGILGQIFGLSRRYHIKIQPQFTLLQKTMVMAEGVARQLNPEANIWPLARDLAAQWAEDQDEWLIYLNAFADKALAMALRLPDLPDLINKGASSFDGNLRRESVWGRGFLWFWACGVILLTLAGAYYISH